MPDTIRFVGNDSAGLPLKRKQSQRACDRCRRRKKRCLHQTTNENYNPSMVTVSGNTPEGNSVFSGTDSPQSQSLGRSTQWQQSSSAGIQITDRPAIHELGSTTAGSKIPTTVSTDNTQQDEEEEEDDHDHRFVGELNPEGTFVAGTSPITAAAANSPEEVVGIWIPKKLANAAKALAGPLLPVLLPYLEAECSRVLPKSPDFENLMRLYNEDFHPILPIINLESYDKQQEKSMLMLKMAICLCVSSNPKAIPHLRRSPKDFATQVTQLLKATIDNGLIQDKQVIIQLLVILAFSTQLSDDRHASAEFTSRAISYVHTGGLHLDTVNRNNNTYITRLFCCTFALDRLNAAIQGRPVLMHERDFGRDLDTCVAQQDSLFQLLLRVIMLLDDVIMLYRPALHNKDASASIGRDDDIAFPAFEEVLSQCGTMRASAPLVATIETLYHAVSMLSCRSQTLSELSKKSISHTRQNLSAASITSIAGSEYRGQLSILPFVPYSLSLALRVSYRDLRLSKSSFTRTRARRQLLHTCSLLRELGDTFPASLHMASLAEQTVREMDKAYSNVAEQRRGSIAPVVHGPRQQENQQEPITQIEGQRRSEGSPRNGTSDQSQFSYTSEPITLPQDYSLQSFDPAQFDFDLDIFDYFDPEFDIQAIDAALADSVDPSIPINSIPFNFVDGRQFE